MALLDRLRCSSPLIDPDPRRGLALEILEETGHTVERVVRVYVEPDEVIVLFVNPHGEARTAWMSTNQDDGSLAVHVSQGFK